MEVCVMADLSWFKFTPSHWMMGKIQRLPDSAQARFMRLCCVYWKDGCKMTIEDARLECLTDYDSLVEWKIIKVNGENIQIEFLDNQLSEIEGVSKQNSQNARMGWQKRRNAVALESQDSAMPNDADKIRRDKKRKEEDTLFDAFWNSYHQTTSLPKTDKESAQKNWTKLTVSEQQKAIDSIAPYFKSLKDTKYCKKARTYLADKNFNDEFKPRERKEHITPSFDPYEKLR